MSHETLPPIDPREIERPFHKYFEVWEGNDAIIDDQVGIVVTGIDKENRVLLRIISPRRMAVSAEKKLSEFGHRSHASTLEGVGSILRGISYNNNMFIGDQYRIQLIDIDPEVGVVGLRVFSQEETTLERLGPADLAIDYLRQRFNDTHPEQFQ